MCAAMFFTAIWMRWELRGRVWFWMTIAALAGIHAALLKVIPWNDRNYPGVVLLPLGLLDLTFIYAAIKLIEKIVGTDTDRKG